MALVPYGACPITFAAGAVSWKWDGVGLPASVREQLVADELGTAAATLNSAPCRGGQLSDQRAWRRVPQSARVLREEQTEPVGRR